MMAERRRRRITPLEDALEHVGKALDKTAELEAKYIDSYKGRGVFAQSNFSKGDFVVEYRGELINFDESIRRRRIYHRGCAVFMFDFHWNQKTWCIDAARDDGSLGRLINDDHKHPNCRMKMIVVEAKPHLCLFALRDIQPGEEITYNYGGNDWPWRKQTKDQPKTTKSSRLTEMDEGDLGATILQTKDQPKTTKSCESQPSRRSEIDKGDLGATILQTKDQPKSTKSCESQPSRRTEMDEGDLGATILQTKDQPKTTKSCESQPSRRSEIDKGDLGATILQTKDQPKNIKSCESQPSRRTEMDEGDLGATILQTKDQPKTTKSCESQPSRRSEIDKGDLGATILQTKDQPKSTKSCESQPSRRTEMDEGDLGATILQTKDQPKTTKSCESQPSRRSEIDKGDLGATILQTKDQPKNIKSCESQPSRRTEMDEGDLGATILQTKDQPKTTKSCESQPSRRSEIDKGDLGATILQTKDQPKTTKSCESQPSRRSEIDKGDLGATILQTKDQPKNIKSCESQPSRRTEMDEGDLGATILQTKDQPKTTKSCESQPSRRSEIDKGDLGATILQTKDQPKNIKSCESQPSRRTEMDEGDLGATILQTKDQPKTTKSCESQPSRRSEIDKGDLGATILQTKDQPKSTKSCESQPSRLTEMDEGDLGATILQAKDQPKTTKSCESQPSRLTEMDERDLGATILQNESGSGPLRKKAGNTYLINDTEFDQSEAPCTSSSLRTESCLIWSPSSPDCSLTLSEHPVPRLRRTKSLLMRGRLDFDSDELYDSDDSGEEYIPKSGQDDSEDTDSSSICTFDQKMNKMRIPSLGKMVDTGKRSQSLQELDNTSSKLTTRKERSPVKKRRRIRRSSSNGASKPIEMVTVDTTEQTGDGATGPMLENSESDQEQNLPDKDSSLDGTPGSSLFIPAVCKKDNGSRMYNKKQYCLYCKEGVIKMARHLERAHKDKPEVAQALTFPKLSKERRMHMEILRNKGNFAHNVEVINSGVGSLVPRQQPKDKAQAGDFLHCAYCQGYFMRKVLWRHVKQCKFKPSIPLKPGRTRIQALCGFTVPPPAGVKQQLWNLLNNMVQDDVFHAVKSDACILEYGEHLYNRLGYDVSKHEYIRQKLRELGRLLLCSRKATHMRTIKEHIKPANFMHVVDVVKELAGYSSEKQTYSCPSLALKIGYSLKKISLLVESCANVKGNDRAAKEAQTFRSVYEARWNELISSSSLRTLQESKWNTPQLIPFTKDVQTLHSFLDAQQQDLICRLSSDTSPQTYMQLVKVVLTQVTLFNRRRAGEASKIPLSVYTSQNVSDPQEDVNVALSDLEKRLCQHFQRIEIRGKRGRKVPVLLTPKMQQALDLLISKRKECGIPTENTYLFARPSSLTYYRATDCLRDFAKACGAKKPECLTSTKLRKQTATMSQVLNLSNTELDQLADFLGHDIRVHRQFYRLPEGTLQLAKISKILMALEQGRLAEFKGKSLDDIHVDPEDSVPFDSDQDSDLEHSLEHPVTTEEVETDVNTSQEDTETDVNTSQEDTETGVITSQEDTETGVITSQEDTVTSTQATDDQQKQQKQQKISKGRQQSKRKRWDEDEIAAVERHMMSFITSCQVPRKSDCDKCINMEKTALKNRDWHAVKFYVNNRITSLKRKF